MNQCMVIGNVDSGKSSLLIALKNQRRLSLKTQAVRYSEESVDTPGEYMENPRNYGYILSLSQSVSCVILLQSAIDQQMHYPPGFVSAIGKPCIGVISKQDLVLSDLESAKKKLIIAGIKEPIFITSAETGKGISELRKYLQDTFKVFLKNWEEDKEHET